MSLLFLDLDHFKQVNDSYGHRVGDDVLQAVAASLEKSLRDSDFCGRYGGEEFAVLLPEAEADVAFAIAERVRQHIGALALTDDDGTPITQTVSIGTASFPADGGNPDELVSAADQAMYQAKQHGRNCVRQFIAAQQTTSKFSG